MVKVSVLGTGGWGMALALSAYHNGHTVCMWTPFEAEKNLLCEKRCNEKLLPGIVLPEDITVTDDISCVKGSQLTIIATPSTAVRSVAEKLSAQNDYGIVVNVSKGLESGSLKRLSEVISEVLPEVQVAVLSGPSHAEEVARNIPTSLVAASKSMTVSNIVQNIMANEFLRIYTSGDLVGVELGGALKNVLAICSGICNGLELGDNSRAALITRGLAEMTRLGVCMGAKEHTFSGLAGLGDLIVTCTSKHSRNNRFGFKVGSGTSVKQALDEVGTVEGYYAALMAHGLSEKYHIEMPIINECYKILYDDMEPRLALKSLMMRPQGIEK